MATDIDAKLDYIQDKLDSVENCVSKIDKEVALQKATFDDHLKQDERMYEEFKRMNDILQQNTESLKEHMYRTELLETIVQKMDIRLSPLERDSIEQQAVAKYRKDFMVRVAKITGILVGVISAIAALWPLIVK